MEYSVQWQAIPIISGLVPSFDIIRLVAGPDTGVNGKSTLVVLMTFLQVQLVVSFINVGLRDHIY